MSCKAWFLLTSQTHKHSILTREMLKQPCACISIFVCALTFNNNTYVCTCVTSENQVSARTHHVTKFLFFSQITTSAITLLF